jgi:hypothetical protein
MEERGTFDADSGQEGQPHVVTVGGGAEQPVVPLWFVLDGGNESARLTPMRLVVTVASGDETLSLQFADVLAHAFRNGDGAPLYRVCDLVPPADVRNLDDCRIDFHVQFDGAPPTWQAATPAQWRAASSSRTPLRFRVQVAPLSYAGSLIVTARTGVPRAGALVTLVPDSVRHPSVIWSDRLVLTTDMRGRASLGGLASGIGYQGFATDLRSGEAASVEGVRADGGDVTVMLEAPTELKLTARLKDETLPRARSALLRSQPFGLLPDVRCTWSDSGEVSAPSVCLAGYTLLLDCSTPEGGRSQLKLPAVQAQGAAIELPPIVRPGISSPR